MFCFSLMVNIATMSCYVRCKIYLTNRIFKEIDTKRLYLFYDISKQETVLPCTLFYVRGEFLSILSESEYDNIYRNISIGANIDSFEAYRCVGVVMVGGY